MTKTTLGLKAQAIHNPRLLARIAGIRTPHPGEEFVWTAMAGEAWAAIFAAMDVIVGREYEVIIARFGEGLTLQECGERFERTRERSRQIEAAALRKLRHLLRPFADDLIAALSIRIIPDGLLDPSWVTVKQAAELTGLTPGHIRFLARGRLETRPHPTNKVLVWISRKDLKRYISSSSNHGRKRGVWKGE